ncbi:hypothetical protein BC834DRAFT_793378, partial [Gloeopeniophorella convolvens]
RAMMSDIHIRLEQNFSLTNEQKTNIRLITGEHLLDPNRILYMKMYIDVEIKLRECEKDLCLFNIFGNLSRQRLLATTVRHSCSSVRNAYREMVR